MSVTRLLFALKHGGLTLPDTGRIAVIAPDATFDLSALPRDRTEIVQSFLPDYLALQSRGYHCVTELGSDYAASVVCLPRSKSQARALVGHASAVTPHGMIVVDGQKVSGVESVLRNIRSRVAVDGTVSKAHGKLFWFAADGAAFANWSQPESTVNQDGFCTAPGLFSSDAVDPGSALLASSLSLQGARVVADLGAGWGYLSVQILRCKTVKTVYLVEAEQRALRCAKLNIADSRAIFHWADGTTWRSPEAVDTVVMNPPFHIGRRCEPELGKAFIAAAAAALSPSGHLWMVANRHLPYESFLSDLFDKVEEAYGTSQFKILHAQRPSNRSR